MRKIFITIACFFIIVESASAGDFYNVHYSSPSLIKNESKYTRIEISAFKTETVQELTINIIDDDGLTVEIVGNNKLSLHPDDSINFDLFIKNEDITFFKKYKKILLEIKTNEQVFVEEVKVSIIPQPFIWPLIGLLFSFIIVLVFIGIFRKLQKGDIK